MATGGHALTVDVSVNSAKHSRYTLREDRRSSFDINWRDDLQQLSDDMVDNGFFYSGRSDFVRCFWCGVGIHQWSSCDNPHIEHARWSPSCKFLLVIKGQDFINSVQYAVAVSQSQVGVLARPPRNFSSTTRAISTQRDTVVDDVVHIGRLKDPRNTKKELKEKNEARRKRFLCKVCLDQNISIVFLPCGHLVTCADCGQNIRRCLFCQRRVEEIIRTTLDV